MYHLRFTPDYSAGKDLLNHEVHDPVTAIVHHIIYAFQGNLITFIKLLSSNVKPVSFFLKVTHDEWLFQNLTAMMSRSLLVCKLSLSMACLSPFVSRSIFQL